MIVITLFFSILRPHNSVVYAPKVKHADKKHAPPPIGNGLFAWFLPVARYHEAHLVEKVGLDAAVFLRFTRMCRNIFAVLTLFGCGILIPVHVLRGNKAIIPQESTQSRNFALLTPQYTQGSPMWSHVVCSWVFDIVIICFLWINYRAVARLRRQYFESPEYQMSLNSRSVWMTDIPGPDRSDEGILRIADSIEQTAGIPRAAIVRNVKELPDLIEEHTDTVKNLESILAKYLKNPDRLPAKRPTIRPSKNDRRANHNRKVDAIEYLTSRIRDLEIEIKDVRQTIDKRNAMPYGFATYERIEEAHSVAFAARKKHPHGVTVKLAPKPNDIIWKNLPLSKKARRGKKLMNTFWVAVLTVVWIAPNALIAIFLSNLSNLSALWPAFAKSFNGNQTTWAIVQAIAAPALTSLVYLLLPIIFRRLSIKAGDLTKTSREKHVTHRLYAFFVFNNLIVFSAFSAVWKFIVSVIENHKNNQSVWDAIRNGHLPAQIMVTLCTISPFWVVWLLQRNLGATIDLAQIINLTWIWFARTFLSPTPRQTIDWTAPPPFDYASYYNYFLFYATVTLCYATLQPLVLPVTAFYFAVDTWLKKYLLLYIFITKTESGGQFWNIVFNRILFATFLANCIAALVIKGALGSWIMIACIAPLPFILLAFKVYCDNTFGKQCKYYIKAKLNDPEALAEPGQKSRRNDRIGIKFGHPALYKPLITPMVHAKAQHVLAQIYRGRLGSDDATDTGYSDIAMMPMSKSHHGKAARSASGNTGGDSREMFEVVPEANLDFAFYKNRAEFSDEHGGDGELYGRPLDLVSERSQTPASFMSDDSDSRSQSPAPMLPRQQRMDHLAYHPAYRDVSGDLGHQGTTGAKRPDLYSVHNESERRLLSAAQPIGVDEPTTEHDAGKEHYEMDRWRTGGSGYVGLSGPADDDEALGYEYYRGRR
ncbi:MAG: hypothetical protein Q9187_003398 [Circinaria calcarea]